MAVTRGGDGTALSNDGTSWSMEMTKISAEFSITQSQGSIERIDLYDGGEVPIVRLEFDGDAPVTIDIETGQTYVVICYLIGEHGDKIQVDWKVGRIVGTLIKFQLLKGALSTRELPDGKLLGVGFTTFVAPKP
jgi:hypothetical protein